VAPPQVRKMFRVVVRRYSALDRRLTRLRFPPIEDQWFRIRMYESVDARIAELNVSTLDAAEISGGASSKYGWRTFTRLDRARRVDAHVATGPRQR
jgi:hypothetical protein